jgi:hypothetical protein
MINVFTTFGALDSALGPSAKSQEKLQLNLRNEIVSPFYCNFISLSILFFLLFPLRIMHDPQKPTIPTNIPKYEMKVKFIHILWIHPSREKSVVRTSFQMYIYKLFFYNLTTRMWKLEQKAAAFLVKRWIVLIHQQYNLTSLHWVVHQVVDHFLCIT